MPVNEIDLTRTRKYYRIRNWMLCVISVDRREWIYWLRLFVCCFLFYSFARSRKCVASVWFKRNATPIETLKCSKAQQHHHHTCTQIWQYTQVFSMSYRIWSELRLVSALIGCIVQTCCAERCQRLKLNLIILFDCYSIYIGLIENKSKQNKCLI